MAFFNNDGPVIQPRRDINLDLDRNTTPAISALQNAFRDGAVDFETINKHFGDAPRMQAEALINQAKSASAKGDIEIQPLKNELAKVSGDVAIQQANTAREVQPRIAALDSSKLSDAERKQKQLDDAGEIGLREAVEMWQANGLGPLPQDPKDLLQTVKDLQAAKLRDLTQGSNAKVESAVIIKRAVEAGIPTTGRSLADIEADIAKVPNKEAAEIDEKGIGTIRQVDAAQPGIDLARQYINDLRTTPVGPGLTEGSAINQWATKAKALFGISRDKYIQQNELEHQVALGVLNSIKALAGSGAGRIMQSEVRLMEQAQPHVSSDRHTWIRWLDKAEGLLKAAREDSLSKLSPKAQEQLKSFPTPQASSNPANPPAVAAPVAPAIPPGLSPQADDQAARKAKAPVVTTPEDLARIQPGQEFVYKGVLQTRK